MKRVLLAAAIALLLPVMLNAQATLGIYDMIYYEPGRMHSYPEPFTEFFAYLYLHNSNYYVTAIEYQLVLPENPGWFTITKVEYPDQYSIHMGDPFNGHSVTYWPYLNGFVPGYNLMCKYICMTFEPCWNMGGAMMDYKLVIGPHPGSGELRGTYYPDNNTFPITGLTSTLCPLEVATQETTWGAIKSQFK